VGKYLLGYDEICVKAKDTISPQERVLVKQTSTRLIGLEIVEEDFTRIVLQCLLEPAASLPMKILRREYNIAASMHRDAVSAFLSSDVNLARNVIARDVEVNRFYFLLVRTLRTVIQNPNLGVKLNIRSIDCLDYRLCASLVETIGDRAVVIANKAIALKDTKISREISQLIGAFHSMVFKDQEKALKAFFEHDVTLAEEVRRDRSYIENKFNDIESAVKEQADQIIPIILTATTSMYQVFSHSVDIADLVMPKIDE
jgi:phosphate uptake regulator